MTTTTLTSVSLPRCADDPRVQAANQKIAKINERRAELEAERQVLVAQLAVNQQPDDGELVDAVLSGDLAVASPQTALRQREANVRRSLEILSNAYADASKERDAVEAEASVAVCRALRDERVALAAKALAAYDLLCHCTNAEREFLARIEAAGYATSAMPGPQFSALVPWKGEGRDERRIAAVEAMDSFRSRR